LAIYEGGVSIQSETPPFLLALTVCWHRIALEAKYK
jgi:hypothetical protein